MVWGKIVSQNGHFCGFSRLSYSSFILHLQSGKCEKIVYLAIKILRMKCDQKYIFWPTHSQDTVGQSWAYMRFQWKNWFQMQDLENMIFCFVTSKSFIHFINAF